MQLSHFTELRQNKRFGGLIFYLELMNCSFGVSPVYFLKAL